MISKRTTRKIYAPLSISTSVEVQGSQAQIFRTASGTYSPDRNTEPLKLVPKIFVGTGSKDNTWVDGLSNKNLSSVKWYVNGVDIQTLDIFAGKYTINGDSGDSRGTLSLNYNVPPGVQYEFVMSAIFTDPRTGNNVTIRTDAVSVFTNEQTVDEWDLSIVRDVNLKYHPLLDKLKEYDWKVANGIMQPSVAERNSCLDGNQYDITLPIIITRGNWKLNEQSQYWNDCNIRLYVMRDEYKAEITPSDCLFVKEISKKGIRLDLRLIPDGTIMQAELEVTFDGKPLVTGSEQLTFTRVVDNYTCMPSNDGDIDTNIKYRFDKAVCTVAGRIMKYPEAYLSIAWYTNSKNAMAVNHGFGEKVVIDLDKVQLGQGNECWLETYIESQVKSYVAAVSIDESGKILLTDSDNNIITEDVLEG